MNWVMRPVLALLVPVMLGAGLTSCQIGRMPFAGETESIVLGTLAHELNGLVYIAQDQRYFAANGLDVAIKTYDTGIGTTDALLKGEVDLAGGAEFILVGRALKGERMRTVATIAKSEDQYVIGRMDRGIRQVTDLQGKRVGVPRQTISEFYLGRFLDLHGMNVRQVSLVDLKPADTMGNLLSGNVDAVVAWEPFASRIREQSPHDLVAWSAQSSQVLYWNLVGTDAWLQSHPQTVTRLLAALAQAELFVQQNPSQAKKVVQQALKYDDDYAETFWANNRYALALDQSLILAMEDEARWMMNNGLAPDARMPDFMSYVYLDGLKIVKRSAVNVIQ